MNLLWQLLRTEGPAAVRDRMLDRLAGWRRCRSFRALGAHESLPQVDILNVLPTPPRPDWGGVQIQLLRRLEAESRLRSSALLFPQADAFRLEIRNDELRRVVRIEATGVAEAVRNASERLDAGMVHVEQSLGFPLGELAELAESDLALVLSIHDFGLFCRRPHLIERPEMRFCHFSHDEERCHRCLGHDWHVSRQAQAEWRAAAQRLLSATAAVVYPSDYLRRVYAGLFDFDASRQHVVAPPVVAAPIEVSPLRTGPVRHVAYVGSVKAHKGAHVLVELIEMVRREGHSDLRWSVYGGGDQEILRHLRSMPGVRVRGYYRADSLPELLRRDGVDLALLLSIWPETYALTLDECCLAGVPVVAFDHGAPAERLRAWGAGTLVDPVGRIGALVTALEELVLIAWKDGTAEAQVGQVQVADAESAAARCQEIYREARVIDSR